MKSQVEVEEHFLNNIEEYCILKKYRNGLNCLLQNSREKERILSELRNIQLHISKIQKQL